MARSVWPTRFRLRGRPWRIVYCSASALERLAATTRETRGFVVIGWCDTRQRLIHVLRTLPATKRRRVLWHEITHARFAEVRTRFLLRCVRSEERLADYLGALDAEIHASLR